LSSLRSSRLFLKRSDKLITHHSSAIRSARRNRVARHYSDTQAHRRTGSSGSTCRCLRILSVPLSSSVPPDQAFRKAAPSSSRSSAGRTPRCHLPDTHRSCACTCRRFRSYDFLLPLAVSPALNLVHVRTLANQTVELLQARLHAVLEPGIVTGILGILQPVQQADDGIGGFLHAAGRIEHRERHQLLRGRHDKQRGQPVHVRPQQLRLVSQLIGLVAQHAHSASVLVLNAGFMPVHVTFGVPSQLVGSFVVSTHVACGYVMLG